MTMLLASVRTPSEAQVAVAGGADIIDLKEPAQGALGRLPDATIAAIRRAVAGRRPTSATIGDMPLVPEPVLAAVRAMAATGVDMGRNPFKRIGRFGSNRFTSAPTVSKNPRSDAVASAGHDVCP